MNAITQIQSYRTGKCIYKKECFHHGPNGTQGERYYMYSATGQSPWHLNAIKAWVELNSQPTKG